MELKLAFNRYRVKLVELEDMLLEKLSSAHDDIIGDVALIEGLENTKKTVVEINDAVIKGQETKRTIDAAREVYRPVAAEGSMLFSSSITYAPSITCTSTPSIPLFPFLRRRCKRRRQPKKNRSGLKC